MSLLHLRGLADHPAAICLRCMLRWPSRAVRSRNVHNLRSTPQAHDSVLSLLEERGYINQIAGNRDALDRILKSRRVGFYAGIDPTAPSLHLGHLLPLMVLFWLHSHGHHVVSLVGGATSKVGDPSGRLTTRAQTAESIMETNCQAMSGQIEKLWEGALQYIKKRDVQGGANGTLDLLNNAHWLDNLNILHFLKTMGNGMRLGALLARDTVKNKQEKGDGMSFSEFTYPLLQAWDWWQMFKDRGVQVQIGGSDQYGNIIAGIDAVKYIAQSQPDANEQTNWLDHEGRIREEFSPMGLTVPLLTTSSGEKFGKSAGNAVWLDRNLTSPFDLYGFLLRSADSDVERYLKLFTFVSSSEISTVMAQHRADLAKRKAQHLLASEVLELVHGPEEAARTQAEHQAMRTPTLSSFAAPAVTGTVPQTSVDTGQATQRVKLPKSLVYSTPFARILYHAGIVATKSEGARLVNKGGVYVALSQPSPGQGAADEMKFVPVQANQAHEVESLVVDGLLIIRTGKWKVRVIEVIEDDECDIQGLDPPGWAEWKMSVR